MKEGIDLSENIEQQVSTSEEVTTEYHPNDYVVHIEQFQGPLDVLLHLIQKSKVDILDLSIAEITDQYIEYLSSMKKLNLEIASDYLLMSARLIEMKSRWLLPRTEDEDEPEVDPREELINRLLEYKKYKDVTSVFKEFEHERQQVYSKEISDISEWVQNETILNTEKRKDIYQLVLAFENMLKRQSYDAMRGVTMEKQEITIEEQLTFIEEIVSKKRHVNLSKILKKKDRTYVVITFLAVLQLARTQKISLEQEENFAEIMIQNHE